MLNLRCKSTYKYTFTICLEKKDIKKNKYNFTDFAFGMMIIQYIVVTLKFL